MAPTIRDIRRLFQPLLLLMVIAGPCLAQDTPSWEFYAGYSLRGADAREYFRSSPIIYSIRDRAVNSNGFQASVTENRNHWFGGTFDFSFYDRTTVAAGTTAQLPSTTNRQQFYSVMYGPKFTFYRSRFVTPYAHLLFGAARMKVSVTPVGPRATDTSFAIAGGAGVDVKVWSRIAVRLQSDYFRSDLLGSNPNSFRASAGVVFHAGKR